MNKLPYFSARMHVVLLSSLLMAVLVSCNIYTFNNTSIDPKIKTIKLEFIDNKATYINPQFSPKLNDKLQQKITNQTRLTRTTNDDAHYQIGGSITRYDATQTVGVSNQQATTNRLTVNVHIIFKNTLENKVEEFDVSRSFDFSANLTLTQAESQLLDEVVRNLTDEIFNRIFSNW